MVNLQRASDDSSYFATIPKTIVDAKGWAKGDELGFLIVGHAIMPEPGDIIIRKVR